MGCSHLETGPFDGSADIPVRGWAPTDTLSFYFDVVESEAPGYPLAQDVPYRLKMGLRHLPTYPYQSASLCVQIQEADNKLVLDATIWADTSLSRRIEVAPRVVRKVVPIRLDGKDERRPIVLTAQLMDSVSHEWLGRTWGSLISHEFEVPSARITFPRAGRYRMTLLPAYGDEEIKGLVSASVSLYK